MRLWTGMCVGVLSVAAAAQKPQASPQAQAVEFARAHSQKMEVHIPMRDGVKLYAAVWVPKDGFADKGPYPFLMTKTPYGCGGYGDAKSAPHVTGNAALLRSGYILVCEDVRGRWNSEGTWLEMTPSKDGKGIDESTDMYDTVEWLLKNIPNNNGKVGIQGISYGGITPPQAWWIPIRQSRPQARRLRSSTCGWGTMRTTVVR